MNRRRILKTIGTADAASMGLSGTSSAAEKANIPTIEELEGKEAKEVLSNGRKSQAYQHLTAALDQIYGDDAEDQKRGRRSRSKVRGRDSSQTTLEVDEVIAYSIVSSDGDEFSLAAFEFETDTDGRSIEVTIPVGGSSPQPAKGVVMTKDEDKFPMQVEEFVLESQAPVDLQSQADGTLEQKGGTQTKVERISVAGATVLRQINDLSGMKDNMKSETSNDGQVSAQAELMDPDKHCDEMANVECWACKDFVTVINGITCSAATYIICGAAAIPTAGLGGLACAIIVGVICWAIYHYGLNNPTDVCKEVCAC